MAYEVCLREEEEEEDDLVRRVTIPLDLLIEILIRLPSKSLMKFKCVSKSWSSLIRSKYLTNRYLTELTVASPRQQPRLYIRFINHYDCECVLLPLSSSSSSSSSLCNGSMSFDQDLTMPLMEGRKMVVLRGFILYTTCGKACIYNPSTRQSVALPLVNTTNSNIVINKEFFYFLGYDPVLDQYKVVCNVVICSEHDETSMTSEHYVFVLEAGGFWKRIEFDQQPHHRPTSHGTCINGVIYYSVSTNYDSCGSVVSFDVRSQVFNMTQAPDVVSKSGEFVDLIEYGGKPAIFDYTDFGGSGLMDLWVLEDVGKWSRKSPGFQHGQMHLLVNDLTVDGTTQTDEVILSVRPFFSPYYIYYYDLQKKDLRKVQISGMDHLFNNWYFYFTLIDKRENIMYLEI